jgi:hypothetical protein
MVDVSVNIVFAYFASGGDRPAWRMEGVVALIDAGARLAKKRGLHEPRLSEAASCLA